MRRALVVNAGASWAAYQIGALRHLVRDKTMRFDVCVGAGIGAMNAACVACGAFDALDEFWSDIGWLSLLRPNWLAPWRAPMQAGPQRRFIERHVGEDRLRARETKLVFGALDLEGGRVSLWSYPGGGPPLIDTLMGAVAFPGMTPPGSAPGGQWVEATIGRGFLLSDVIDEPVDEIVVIGAAATKPGRRTPPTKNWRTAMARTFALNQSHDVWHELDVARGRLAAMQARTALEHEYARLCEAIPDRELADRLGASLAKAHAN
ncbi:MAG: patatin-like phospholipase family protein, partial [Solirubrobacteraceae bacterium]